MRALTLWRPWDWAILNGKPVENRNWKPPPAIVGQRIALHSGKVYDYEAGVMIRELLGRCETLPAGHIVGTTLVVGWVERDTEACRRNGVKTLISAPGLDWALESPWFFGPYGWVLQDTRALARPIPRKGAQGLWLVPTPLVERIREQEAA